MQRLDFDKKFKQHGHNVSFSQRHTKKVWKPNLQAKTIVIDGKKVKARLSTTALTTVLLQSTKTRIGRSSSVVALIGTTSLGGFYSDKGIRSSEAT